MPGRFSVRGAMIGVALIGLCLGLGRVHVSLGSFAFGVLSLAWVGAARWAERRRTVGSPPGPGAVAANFLASAALAALLLAACLVPAVVLAPMMLHVRRSHGGLVDGPLLSWVAASAVLAVLIVRAVRYWPRAGRVEPGPAPAAEPARWTIGHLMRLVLFAGTCVAAFRAEFFLGCAAVVAGELAWWGWDDGTRRPQPRPLDWPAEPARAVRDGLRTLATVAAVVLFPLIGGAVLLVAIVATGRAVAPGSHVPPVLGALVAGAATVGLLVELVRRLWR